MTWFKVDDSFHDHPKVFDAPDCAVALWTRAGTWSARNLTEGFVPSGMPARLCDDHATAIKELVRRGLWSRVSGGWKFHDWDKYQPSKAEVEDLRSKRSAAGKLGGQARAANQNASKSQASASPVGKQNSTPTRPVPKGREVQVDNGGESSVTRASPPTPPTPPEPRCPEHLNDPDPPPCGRCAEARRGLAQWHIDTAATAAELDRTSPRCRTHPTERAHNCRSCAADSKAGDP